MKKLLAFVSILAILLGTITILGSAAKDSATVTVGFTVAAHQSLQISSNSSSSNSSSTSVESVYTIPDPNNDDLEKGYIKEENALELVASSNIGWEVQVEAKNKYLGTSDNGKYKKPISDLSVRGKGKFKQVSMDPITIAEGQPGTFNFGVDYKVQYDKTEYEKGNYEASLIYTITSS